MKHFTFAILSTLMVACGGTVDAPAPLDAPGAAPDAGIARTLCPCVVGAWRGQQWCAPDGGPLGPCIADSMPPVERFAHAVCACEGNPPGCLENVLAEAWRGNAECIDAMARGYEVDCTGRSGPNGCGP